MRPDLTRLDLTGLQVPPTWSESDGHRAWPMKVLAPARDTSRVLATILLVSMFAACVNAVAVNVRTDAYVSLAINVLLLGTVLARYSWRVLTIWRVAR